MHLLPGRERILSRLAASRKRAAFWIDVVSIVRPNGLLLLAAVGASLWLLGRDTRAVTSFFDRSTFFSLIAMLLGAIALFYVAAVVVPYLWFLLTYYILRRNRNQILFKFPRETCVLGETFDVDAILQRKMRLLFGAITFRLVFWNYDTTDWYFLLRSQTRKGQLFNSTDRGAIASFSMQFRHVGRFRTRYSVVKFEDPLGLFSLPIVEKEYHPTDKDKNFTIYSLPVAPRDGVSPWYRKRMTVPGASDQKFRVAEDYFDHKRYEPTDDSRRILWQVYARTGELLVRIPERDPVIDADLDLYAIFYNSWLTGDSERFRRSYDAYVTAIGRFIETLRRQRALNIRLITDCAPDPPYEDDPMLAHDENLRRAAASVCASRKSRYATMKSHRALRTVEIEALRKYIR